MSRNVLIVEDEPELAKGIQRQLEDLSCIVEVALTGETGLELAQSKPFDLVILDIMLPGMDGLEVCRRLRARREYTPVLMLTARASEIDKVLGLEMGADDYMTKPFSAAELTARVKATFRRSDVLSQQANGLGTVLRAGSAFTIDPRSREMAVRGQPVPLTHKEFDLLLQIGRAHV